MIKFIDATDRAEWDAFIISHPESNFLQSWDFYEFHASRGNSIIRRLAYDDKKIVAAYAGVVERAKRGHHLAIAGGPILDWSDISLAKSVIQDIRNQAQLHKCSFARLRPQLSLYPEPEQKSTEKTEQTQNLKVSFPEQKSSLDLMKQLGLKKAPTFLSVEHAAILDLNKSDDELRHNMHRRIRYAINNAKNKGFEVTKSQNPNDIDTFYQIQLDTAKRQGFYAFSKDFLKKQFTAFAKNNEATLYICRYNGEILAENFMIFYGQEASYHYAVSTELGTRLSGSPILHWEAIHDARSRGITRYNLWGIVDENDTSHRFYGVSFFKRGFGGSELKYTPAHDLVINPLSYYLKTYPIEKIRKILRHT